MGWKKPETCGYTFKIVLLFIFVTGFSQARALTLEELVREGLKRAKTIRTSEYEVQMQAQEVNKAFSSFLPTLTFQSTFTRTEKLPEMTFGSGPFAQKITFGFKNNYQNTLNLNYILFAGGLRLDAYNLSRNMLQVKSLQLEQTRNEVRNRIELAYYSYKLVESALAIAESSFARTKEHLEVSRAQFNEGRIPKLSLQQAELSLSQALVRVNETKTQLQIARQALAIAVGFPQDTVFEVEGSLAYIPFDYPLDSLIHLGFKHRPELKTFAYLRHIAELAKDMAWKKYLPSIGISLTYSYNKPFYYENEFRSNWMTTVFFKLPIFDGFYNKYEYESARINIDKILSQENQAREGVEFEIRSGYLEFTLAKEQLELARHTLDLASAAYKTAEEQFNNGFLSNLEYKDAELQYTQAEFGYISALHNYLKARSSLMKSSGLYDIREEK